MPGFVTIRPHTGNSGVRNWCDAFLPGPYQVTPVGVSRPKCEDMKKEPIQNLLPQGLSVEQQRYELDMLRSIDLKQAELNKFDERLESRIQSFELAFRMQGETPDAFDISKESDPTKRLYGVDDPVTADYGWQCLLARRLVERGVRIVQCNSEGWDQHTEIARRHAEQSLMVDKPIARLLADLESRG